MSIDRIDAELRAAMQQAVSEDKFAPTPVVRDHLAVVVSADGYTPKAGGDPVILLEVKLVGGQHDGVTVRDYLGIRDDRANVRGMALRRLNQAMVATGCESASSVKAMAGQRLLISTREGKPGNDGQTRVFVDRYSAPSAEDRAKSLPNAQAAPAQSANPEVPPFAKGR